MLVLALGSCEKDTGRKAVSIVPSYSGAPVTVSDREFTKKDFMVIVSYEDGSTEFIDDYDFELVGLDAGYYVLEFTYQDVSNPLYIKCEIPIYPSDFETGASE